MRFKICLAGQIISVETLFEDTISLCRKYVVNDRKPDIHIKITASDIEKERAKSKTEAIRSHLNVLDYEDGYLETLAVYRKIAEGLLDYDVILFHGSAVSLKGNGFLFTAKSGTGKSTHTKLWREVFKDQAIMINDDKPLLKVKDDVIEIYGTPWSGKHHLDNNIMAPLSSICILERGNENNIEEITFKDAYPMALQQCYRPGRPDKLYTMLKLLDRLGKRIRWFRMRCTVSSESVQIAYHKMGV